MDRGKGFSTARVLFCFLNDRWCENPEFRRELDDLEPMLALQNEDEDLQTDGHFCSSPQEYVGQERPRWQDELMEEATVRNIAASLSEIADQLERRMLSQATWSLTNTLVDSAKECWRGCLSKEVETLLRSGVSCGLEQLPQERLLLALTFTLVRGVCQRAPRLLHGLFEVALQYVHDSTGW